jgi:hypothetical protein
MKYYPTFKQWDTIITQTEIETGVDTPIELYGPQFCLDFSDYSINICGKHLLYFDCITEQECKKICQQNTQSK